LATAHRKTSDRGSPNRPLFWPKAHVERSQAQVLGPLKAFNMLSVPDEAPGHFTRRHSGPAPEPTGNGIVLIDVYVKVNYEKHGPQDCCGAGASCSIGCAQANCRRTDNKARGRQPMRAARVTGGQ
jgi:hypothetical protein